MGHPCSDGSEAARRPHPVTPSAVPRLVMTLDDLRDLTLDRRDHLVISLIDGRNTVEMVGDIAGLDAHQVLRVVAKLLRLGAIELREP